MPEGTERRPIGRFKHWLDDEFLSNTAFGAINRVVARQRSWIPRVNNIAASMLSAREYVDDSYNVFVSPRTVRFRESEFAMPREALPDVLGELKKWFDAGHENISFPIEVRFTAADDVWMSTGHERDNVYVAVHQYVRSDYQRLLRRGPGHLHRVRGSPALGQDPHARLVLLRAALLEVQRLRGDPRPARPAAHVQQRLPRPRPGVIAFCNPGVADRLVACNPLVAHCLFEERHVTDLDRIDRSININATAESVWDLISQPGWWINPGTIVNNQIVDPCRRRTRDQGPAHTGASPYALKLSRLRATQPSAG